MLSVSASIVTYNNAGDIEKVLYSLYHYTKGADLTVYVIDNASTDDTVERVRHSFPQAKILCQNKNIGFGSGHNRVRDVINSDYHLIINPDVYFDGDVITRLCEYMELHKDVVVTTPQILSPNGEKQSVPRRAPSFCNAFVGKLERFNKSFAHYRNRYTLRNCPLTEFIDLTFCTGCFMLVRTDAFISVGGFDERFFLYCEDADLTRRLLQYGRALCLPQMTVFHKWGRGSARSLKLLLTHVSSMMKYTRKWKNKPDRISIGDGPMCRTVIMSANGDVKKRLVSVLPQIGIKDEIIAVGDCDNEFLQGMAENDHRIRLVDSAGRGRYESYESALKICRGDIIFLCETDCWQADRFEKINSVFDGDIDCMMVLGDGEKATRDMATCSRKAGKAFVLKNSEKEVVAFRRELLYSSLPFPYDIRDDEKWLCILTNIN